MLTQVGDDDDDASKRNIELLPHSGNCVGVGVNHDSLSPKRARMTPIPKRAQRVMLPYF